MRGIDIKTDKMDKDLNLNDVEIRPEIESDPMIDPSQDGFDFCLSCQPHVLMMVQYIRDLENAAIVAQQAIESLSTLNEKLQVKYFNLTVENGKLKKKEIGGEGEKLKVKMDKIDGQVNRLHERKKLGAE